MNKQKASPQSGELFALDEISEEPAPASTPSTVTDNAERRDALNITQSWIAEAPAGSGKTGLLIQRYLKLLARTEVQQPEQVLAITFTLKAAGEIRDRVLEQLQRALAETSDAASDFEAETLLLAREVLERDTRFGWEILQHPQRLNLRTIDSICAEIAHRQPVLSGSSGLSPVEDAGDLYRLAAERTLLLLGGSDTALSSAIELLLLQRDGNLQKCQELIADMLALRDQWGRLIPLDKESLEESFLDGQVLPQLEDTLASAICSELEEIERSFPRGQLERLASLANEMSSAEGYKDKPSPLLVCRDRLAPPQAVADDLPTWQALAHLLLTGEGKWRASFNANHMGFSPSKELVATLREIVETLSADEDLLKALRRLRTLPPPIYPRSQWLVAKALFRVLYRSLAELQIIFAERGECDFTELALLARTALQHESSSVENSMGIELQHILVDEMQDTSTSQYELLQLLTQGWDGHSQTLFLVGDPKQSIYLFRQARVERFVRTMSEEVLGGIGLKLLRLRSNFRSQAGLVNAFNGIFSNLFPRESDHKRPDEATYVPAEPVRPASFAEAPSAHWHTQVIAPNTSEESTLPKKWFARREATHIRRIIEQWRAMPLPEGRRKPWKIAVLVRNRSHLSQIVAELKRTDGSGPIPFRAVDIESLAERPEVLDLFALTRAALHPADRIAWLSVLRAPWCGLELADLHMLCGQDDAKWEPYTVTELIDQRGDLLGERGRQALQRIRHIIASMSRQHSRIPLAELVERTWKTLGGDSYLTPEELSNVQRYLDLLYDAEQHGSAVNLESLKQKMRKLYADSIAKVGAVDLMTIHGSKGLEWDVVLLPGLEKKARTGGHRLLVWDTLSYNGQEDSGVIFAPIQRKGEEEEKLNRWLREVSRRREEAETKRLFYVACTRAREELHLFATLKQRQDSSLHPESNTLLAAAWPAAESHFVDSDLHSKPLIASIVAFPEPTNHAVLPQLAAEAKPRSSEPLYRLPVTFVRTATPSLRLAPRQEAHPSDFVRPEGSFEARMVGTAVHAFLELMANKISSGHHPSQLLKEIQSWTPRITALLRSSGIPSSKIPTLVPTIHRALANTLQDPEGLWILQSHRKSISEHGITSWDEEQSRVRLDRIFRAGDNPTAAGEDHLWIVDYKTAANSRGDISYFMQAEREKYAPQLETYARILRGGGYQGELRVGLYYPLLPRFIWWTP
ncbi:MAG: UvrD-helicase domain-containing protein [Edaphobacter sp.]|uniref:UvrD-helicase domain-containing protein n=1 Tax=Edaphobacter sp. TaxID=1934404 RepID=UPI00238B0C34|nr:UvrD-helicase domain-containing protein [Edaphobacter sp.]MDE1175394.1 UvrD-helicase domain-containing protein [Edaphobacter sp.]